MRLSWENKLAAFQSLGDTSLRMRSPGDWYVSSGLAIGGDGMLTGSYGNGKTPREAVEDHWSIYVTNLPTDRYVVTKTHAGGERRVRWSGFGWSDVHAEPRK